MAWNNTKISVVSDTKYDIVLTSNQSQAIFKSKFKFKKTLHPVEIIDTAHNINQTYNIDSIVFEQRYPW